MANDPKLIAGRLEELLAAGCFSSWLRRFRHSLTIESEAVVPCGECNACCKSSYFIHIRPEETQTIARINKKLLFAAPGLPKGNVLLGYDQHGCCPMLVNGKCSIYEHRPQTCRNYDCRIFTAAGITADDKALINQRIRRWKFSYTGNRDYNLHSAVQTAAKFLREHAECFPAGVIPGNATQLAVLAIKAYDIFLEGYGESGKTGQPLTDQDIANRILEVSEKFEAGSVRS